MKKFFNFKTFSRLDILFFILIILLVILLFFFSLVVGLSKNQFSNFFKGSDYNFYYDNCKLILKGEGSKLYDINYYNDIIVKNSTNYFKTIYSPILYYFFIPLILLPPKIGLFFTILILFLLYMFSIFILILTFKRLFKYRIIILFFCLLFMPFIYSIFSCHPSIIWIFILSLSFYFAKKDRLFISGIILSFFLMHPYFYLLLLCIIIFTFKPRLISGFLLGSIFIIFLTGILNKFYLWNELLKLILFFSDKFLIKDTMMIIKSSSKWIFFYPINNENNIKSTIQYIFILAGIFSIIPVIIYSFLYKKNFSRNTFWFILTMSIVLASPYLYNFELIILLLPIIIFVNLMLADRVQLKYIILILLFVFILIFSVFLLSMFILVQLFSIILWFFLINGIIRIRIRNYTPKNFISYWEDY